MKVPLFGRKKMARRQLMTRMHGIGRMRRGVSLVEGVIALGLFSLVISSVWITVFNSYDGVMGDYIAIKAMNELKNLLEEDFFVPAKAAPVPNNPDFSFSLSMPYITECLIQRERKIAWNFGRNRNITGQIILPDLPEIEKLGKDCGGYPDYKNTINILTENIPSLSLGEATGIDIAAGRFFVSAIDLDNEESLPDLLIGTPSNFIELDVGTGLNSLDVAEGFVYAAHRSSAKQLVVVDARNPSNIFVTASSTLPGVAGERPEGWSIFFYDSRIYIGTKRTAGHEFHIFDVSNPPNPVWLGSREINHNINDIAVHGSMAFLATSGNQRDLIVLDVTDPGEITQIATLDLPGNEDGKSLALLGERLYIGRFKSTAGNPEFHIVDVSQVKNKGIFSLLGSFVVGADINAIKIANDIAILGTSKTGANLQILRIASTTNISLISSKGTPQKITAVDYENNNFMATFFGGDNLMGISFQEN